MGYRPKTLIGGALFLGSVVLFNVKLLDLLEIGTCASGGPYVSARPCPEGTGSAMLLLMASVFGALIGLGIFAFRGDSPGGRRRRGAASAGLLAWAIFFTGTGAASLYASLTGNSFGDDTKLGGIIVGATFLLIGLPVLVYLVWAWISDLREPGAMTDAEFEAQKRRILGG